MNPSAPAQVSPNHIVPGQSGQWIHSAGVRASYSTCTQIKMDGCPEGRFYEIKFEVIYPLFGGGGNDAQGPGFYFFPGFIFQAGAHHLNDFVTHEAPERGAGGQGKFQEMAV